jgi:hypothetical protein
MLKQNASAQRPDKFMVLSIPVTKQITVAVFALVESNGEG